MTKCPNATAIKRLLSAPFDPELLEVIASYQTIDQLKESLALQGIDVSSCNAEETLQVIREVLGELSDADLAQAQGGEVKVSVIAVGVGTAAAVGVGAAAVTVGVLKGGA
jgi:hypothetical protein